MKKLLVIGFTFILSLVFLVGCSNGENESITEIPTDEDVTEEVPNAKEAIFGGEDFLLWIDHEEFAIAIIQALEENFPGVNFLWNEMGNVDSLTNLSLDGPAGLGADIVFFPHDHIHRAINEQLVLPVGPAISKMMDGRFHAVAVDSLYDNLSGFHFGIPMTTESVALFYNRTLLEGFGFEPATTFEELIDQVLEMNNPANNEFHFRFRPGNAFDMHFVTTAHGFELFGSNHIDPDQVNLNSPEVIAGLEWFLMLRESILNVPASDLDDDNTFGAFLDGEVAYLITGPWNIGDIVRDGNFELGIKKIPTINGNQPITFSGNIVVAGSAFTKHADLTRAVLEFLASDEGIQIMYDTRGVIPALIDGSVINGLSDNSHHMGILEQANYSHPMPIIPEMSHFWEVADGMYSVAWDGILTPEEAAEHAELGYDSARALAQQ